ncbi:MAG: hypothetical protein RLZZ04_1746 [Cyanobacteriota bacterium]
MLYLSLLDFFPATFIPGGMAESVDAVDLKSADRKVVGVQVSLPPPPLARRSIRLSVTGSITLPFWKLYASSDSWQFYASAEN